MEYSSYEKQMSTYRGYCRPPFVLKREYIKAFYDLYIAMGQVEVMLEYKLLIIDHFNADVFSLYR